MRRWLSAVLLAAMPALVAAQGGHYQTGGAIALPASLQERLDRFAKQIRLGVNTDHLERAKVSAGCYIRGIEILAQAAEDGIIPGAVVYIDSLEGDAMPIGIGNRITDPESHPAEWSSLYEIGDLAAALIVTPLALSALEQGELKLSSTVGEFIPELSDSDKALLTVEQLMRHSTGLPASPQWPADLQTRDDVMRAVRDMPFARDRGTCVMRSPLNCLLLAAILERLKGKPVRDAAMAEFFEPLGLRNTVGELPLGWRGRTAAGPYCESAGRMMWGEPADRAARILGPSAGYAGIVTTADDLGTLARLLLAANEKGIAGFVSGETMSLCTSPDERLEGGATMGLGWELGRLGEGSFGWDAANGCSMWLDPRTGRFLILLTNFDHPGPKPSEEQWRIHQQAFELLADSLDHRTRAVDSTIPGRFTIFESDPFSSHPGWPAPFLPVRGG